MTLQKVLHLKTRDKFLLLAGSLLTALCTFGVSQYYLGKSIVPFRKKAEQATKKLRVYEEYFEKIEQNVRKGVDILENMRQQGESIKQDVRRGADNISAIKKLAFWLGGPMAASGTLFFFLQIFMSLYLPTRSKILAPPK